jgi:hypothetical protein
MQAAVVPAVDSSWQVIPLTSLLDGGEIVVLDCPQNCFEGLDAFRTRVKYHLTSLPFSFSPELLPQSIATDAI